MARPTGSKDKLQRRLDEETVEREAAERRGRLRLALGAITVVVVLVGVVLAIGAFRDPTGGAETTTVDGVELAGLQETRTLLAGVPQDGTLLGDPDAPVTIHEFADLKCPACQQYEIQRQPETVRALIRTGKANMRLHLINIIDRGHGTSDGTGLRTAAYNLAATGKLWSFVHATYYNQGPENDDWATETRLREIATGAPGVGAAAINVRETPSSRTLAFEADKLATQLKVQGTPSFFVEPRGTDSFAKVENPYEDLVVAVEDATGRAKPLPTRR